MIGSTRGAPGRGPLSAPLVVYDLDGVITRRDSFTAFVLARLRRSPAGFLRAVPHAIALAAHRSPDARQRDTRKLCRIALRRLDHGAYAALAEELGERIGARPDWIREDVVEDMRARRERGETIVVATATERTLAAAILRAAGAPHDLLSASSLVEGEGGGLVFGDHRVGERKLSALRDEGVPISDALFVTDSATDLPTALAAAHVRLVGASEHTRRRFMSAGAALIDG